MKKVAIIGTQGIPTKYGGFETLAEYLVEYLGYKLDITVFASSKIYGINAPVIYKGVKIEYLPYSANGFSSIIYDSISLIRSCKRFDKIVILGASGGLVMPFLKRYKHKFILNFGGMEWQREKWGFFASNIMHLSEIFAVRYSLTLVADNIGIQNYILSKYKRESNLIEYGGDQVNVERINNLMLEKYPFLNDNYFLNVARIQVDNNIEMILKAFEKQDNKKIVIIGNWDNSKYGINLKKKYLGKPNIVLLDAIYNQKELNVIRSNTFLYLHGHSAGGTNPGLVEVMNLGLPIFCYGNIFNKFTTEDKAKYFISSDQLSVLLDNINNEELLIIKQDMKEIAQRRYKWSIIAEKYYKLIV